MNVSKRVEQTRAKNAEMMSAHAKRHQCPRRGRRQAHSHASFFNGELPYDAVSAVSQYLTAAVPAERVGGFAPVQRMHEVELEEGRTADGESLRVSTEILSQPTAGERSLIEAMERASGEYITAFAGAVNGKSAPLTMSFAFGFGEGARNKAGERLTVTQILDTYGQ